MRTSEYDAIIIGSGFGAAMAARPLVEAKQRVLMIERGDWVARGEIARQPESSLELTPHYSAESPIRVIAGGNGKVTGSTACVGGPSVFYGGVSLRFRERDFDADPSIAEQRWPIRYDDLEPYYDEAERLLDVAGDDSDPCAPRRTCPYPQDPSPLAPAAARVRDASASLGLKPFRLPLAINHRRGHGRDPCALCRNCDTFACFANAKNDLATAVIPQLIARGMTLAANTVATRLVVDRDRIVRVEAFDKSTHQRIAFEAERFVLAAGALHTPHLLLASELDALNPAGALIGTHLIRHSSAIVYGIFSKRVDPALSFHKQIGIHDFYFGDPEVNEPEGKLGSLQSMHPPPRGLVRARLPVIGGMIAPGAELMSGLLAMAEDQPRAENRVSVDFAVRDRFGLPQLSIEHRHSARDRAATSALVRRAKQILRRAGAVAFYVHEIRTFSHALGTVRMGLDERTSPLDRDGRFRGLTNLWITDGSALPRSAAVNPSLTIAANALRVGASLS